MDHDIVMMALPRWDGPYSSTAYSLAKELSRYTRVFYIDYPFTVKEFVTKRNSEQVQRRKEALLKGENFFTTPDAHYPNLLAITPKLTLPINWLSEGFWYDTFSKWNDSVISNTLNKVFKIFGVRKYIFINSFNPLFGQFLSLNIKPSLTVYQSVDDISQAPYMEKHGPRLENAAIKKADFTIVTSSELKKQKSQYSKKVFLLPNAANVLLFQRALRDDVKMPREISEIPKGKKIITYTGNICQRLDYELLEKISKAHRDKIILMIGPRASGEMAKSEKLLKLPNVLYVGMKKIEELPAYLKYSDCCVIPFLCNQLTKSIYPLKINEYLSSGKPVVTTNFSEDILGFKKVAHIAETHDQFIQCIEKAIDEDSALKVRERVNYASANNWEARAHHFIDLCVEFLKHHDRGRGKSERRNWQQAVYQ